MTRGIPLNGILQKIQQGLRQAKYEQLGQLAVSGGFITPGQLEKALQDQESGPRRPLGEILVTRELLSSKQLEGLLLRQKSQDVSRVGGRTASVTPREVVDAEAEPEKRFGRYVLVREIGQGAMGTVWKGWDKELLRWVAVKVLKLDSARTRDRFLREARVTAGLRHPNLVTVFDAGEVEGRPYIVMELIQGMPLDLATSVKDSVVLLRKVALALQEAHDSGVVHRDLKPGNILMDRNGEPHVVDFGLASVVDSSVKLTRTGAVMGTPAYMAPEQVSGDAARIGPATDVYALGVILYEALSGSVPFFGTPAQIFERILNQDPKVPEGPRDLVTVCLKAMDKNPDRRYASSREFSEDLRRYLSGEPVRARPPTFFHRITRMLRRKRVLAGVAVGAVLLAVGVSIFFVPRWLESRHQLEEKDRQKAALDRARPHVSRGSEILVQLDKLLTNPSAPDDKVKELAGSARAEFRKALKEYALFPEAWLGVARSFRMERRFEDALSLMDRAIGSGVDYGPAYLERMLLMLDKYLWLRLDPRGGLRPETKETEALRAKIDLDLGNMKKGNTSEVIVRYAEGILMLAEGKPEEALPRFRDYAEQRMTDAMAWYHLGMTSWQLGKTEDALLALGESIRYRPNNISALMLRSAIRARRREWKAGIEDLDQILKLRRAPVALSNRGSLRSKMGDFEGALKDLDEALTLDPDIVSALVNRSSVHLALGNIDSCFEDLDRVMELRPGYYLGYVGRYNALYRLRRYREALDVLGDLIEEYPKKADPWFLRGRLKIEMKQVEEGVKDLDQAIRVDPRLAKGYLHRSVALRRLDRMEAALSDINQAIFLSPRDSRAYYNRGALLHDMKRSAEAIDDYNEALRIDPEYALCWYSRGLVKASLGDAAGTRADFEKALEVAGPGWSYRTQVEARLAALKKAMGDQ